MLPTQSEIEIPLLQALIQHGGQGRPRDIYPLLTAKFPQIAPNDLTETVADGHSKWHNRIQWVRQRLVEREEVASGGWGIWKITDKGRQRAAGGNGALQAPAAPTFLELYEKYEASFQASLLERLLSLSPHDFEHFGRRILLAYGFVNVNVTRVSKDGGIDGYGRLTLGLATLNAAFQCKRWQGNIGRPEVDKSRGAIQGEFEQGVFFASSDFTPEARAASLKKGAVPILLFNGESIVRLMIEKGIGVKRTPLHAYLDQLDEIIETEGS
jgi:restriction system protein